MRIVVIGAGVIGVSTAYFLAKDGHEVTVLDREADVAMGASFANGAILTPSMADPWNAPGVAGQLLRYMGKENSPLLLRPRALPSLFSWGIRFLRHSAPEHFQRATLANAKISSYSSDVLKMLEREHSLQYDQGPGGDIKFARDPKGFENMVNAAQTMMAAGVGIEVLDAAGAVAREPALAGIEHEIAGALYIASDMSGDARKYTQGLALAARALGVEFVQKRTISGFVQAEKRVVKVMANGPEGAESYNADAVVIAAGSWSPDVARKLGLKVQVKPVKGYSITTPRNDWKAAPRIPVVDNDFHAVVTPLGDRLRVAGTAEFTGFDMDLTQARIDNLTGFLFKIYPAFKAHFSREAVSPWCGFRPMSADGMPFIGQSQISNVYLNTGHGHLGWTMAAGSGRFLADILSDKAPAIDPKPYDPRRR